MNQRLLGLCHTDELLELLPVVMGEGQAVLPGELLQRGESARSIHVNVQLHLVGGRHTLIQRLIP